MRLSRNTATGHEAAERVGHVALYSPDRQTRNVLVSALDTERVRLLRTSPVCLYQLPVSVVGRQASPAECATGQERHNHDVPWPLSWASSNIPIAVLEQRNRGCSRTGRTSQTETANAIIMYGVDNNVAVSDFIRDWHWMPMDGAELLQFIVGYAERQLAQVADEPFDFGGDERTHACSPGREPRDKRIGRFITLVAS